MYCYRRGNRELSTKPFSFLLWYVLIDIQNEPLQQEKWGVSTEVFFLWYFLINCTQEPYRGYQNMLCKWDFICHVLCLSQSALYSQTQKVNLWASTVLLFFVCIWKARWSKIGWKILKLCENPFELKFVGCNFRMFHD